jgi:hypothetical protein
MGKKIAKWVLGSLMVLWGLSLLPGAVASEAQNDFVNIVGKDVGIDVHEFCGPRRISYRSFTWHHVDSEGDSLYVDITVRPYLFGFNSISYRTSSASKSLEDFPGITQARRKQ